jgi:ribonuclease-3
VSSKKFAPKVLSERAHAEMTKALGIDLTPDMLMLAMTHRSFAYEQGGLPPNERLEFLGDSVLGIVITEKLYRDNPDKPEGELAKIRASVVNMHALAEVAQTLGVGEHVLLGKGELLTGGREKVSILADCVEALLGAIYLEHGLEPSREVILRLFAPQLARSAKLGAALDWKTSLQELTAQQGRGVPSYRISSTGPDHNKEFTATVVIGGADHGVGVGRTKKEAEQKAAAAAWQQLSEPAPAGD